MITYNVTAQLQDQAGTVIEGATLAVTLTKADIDPADGYVAPGTQTFTTDVNGQAVMALWPNARGSTGSEYRVQATDAAGTVLFVAVMSVPEADSNFFDIATIQDGAATLQPYPPKDTTREDRVVADLIDFMKADDLAAVQTRVKRWITHVLNDAKRGRKWWFLENVAVAKLEAGADIIDLKGDLDKVVSIWAPKRLRKVSLQTIVALRQDVKENNRANAGTPDVYALEAGKRLHLFPAPGEEIDFLAHYTRPLKVEIVPEEWETLILEGVIGLYGRHFDRDALVESPKAFLDRYKLGLKELRGDAFDIEQILADWNWPAGTTTVTALSGSGAAVERVVPASLTGIGYECIYTLTVN